MPPKFISIKDFDSFQHFKKANPPWVKMYRSTFSNREFMRLPVASKFLYLGLVMLASEGCNRVPYDLQYISHRLATSFSHNDLTPLYKAGLLEAAASTIYRVSSLSVETETETEESRGAVVPTATKSPKGKRSISDEDKPTEKHFAYGQRLGVDVGPEWGKFVNYCKAHDRRYADFEAAFRNWLANAANFKGGVHAVR